MIKMKKISILIVLSIIALLVFIIIGSWIYNKFATAKEIKNTPHPGQMVTVNGHDMHVYTQGKSDTTIVFMAGGGTSSPTLDFKPLWSELLPKYRIAVVEKAGYGWSEIADVPRDIDFILEETRSALDLAGEKPPYVLAPHSMSGIEAIHWAQKYPEEVEAIIGLDPAIPGSYQAMEVPSSSIQSVAGFAARTGLLRLFPNVANGSAAIQSEQLSSKDEDIYRSIFYRRTLTSNMQEEVKQIQTNASKVGDEGLPAETPMYFFISDGTDVGIENWREMLSDYTEQVENGSYLYIDAGHYIHVWEPELIAEEIDHFLGGI
ncbi:alpha/beta hydrolase [Virgibacillus sp. NKC19-16]|uniref:alpha/beta fold hydrolase n=1 Tax=Virgibacillus salidurans TaxID=2831673 RepID=UPI001F210B2B|nr:alpha/beta hydrolase [Virgibacillus sp. NKC19-16]UJL46785.1 alpha/beta hydrolase [Virgibacillus sp. NKC19-16]